MAAPTRRALFGAGLAVAAATAPAVAFATPIADDAALFTLIRALKAAGDVHDRADVAAVAAHQRYKQLLGQPPGALRIRGSDWFARLPMGDTSELFYTDLDACIAARDSLIPLVHFPIRATEHARCVEVVDALTIYQDRAQAAEDAANIRAADAVEQAALEAEDAILDQIRSYRPKTREGFTAKAKIAARFIDDQAALNAYGTKWAQAILADVQSMRSPLSS